jgi:hypothetical protein
MSFYVEKGLDLVATNMAARPEFEDRYEALKELRGIDKGQLYRGSEWKRVASLQGPILDLACVLDPDFLRERRRFYAFLDQHLECCTYDRRKESLPNQVTFQDGKVIV